MMEMFFFLTLLQLLSLHGAFHFSCPSHSHWKLRAESRCLSARYYTCLFDVTLQVNTYRDTCSRPRILSPGYKYVFQPNLNRATCSVTRYQPFIFETVGYSDCSFIKSLCNSEGQKTYENGNTTSDRTCSCNVYKGYYFVKNLNNQIYCNPSNEDCSCYVRIQPNNKTICSKGLKCDGEIIKGQSSLREDLYNISQELKIKLYDRHKYNIAPPTSDYRTKAFISVLILFAVYSFGVVIFFLQSRIRRQRINSPLELKFHKEDHIPSSIRGPLELKFHKEDHIPSSIRGTHELKFKTEDHIQSHIREQMKQQIDNWKVKDKQFICTRAYRDVLAKISSNSCVTVTGSGGSGKSAIVRHVSLTLLAENVFDIILIATPTQLQNYYKPGKKTLFVLDDVCGKFTAIKGQIDNWCLFMELVNQVIADDSCKILLSCRLQVYKDPKFSKLKPFKLCECNIISYDLSLTGEEKRDIAKQYLNVQNIDDSTLSRNNDMFPLLCDLYSNKKNDLDFEKYLDGPFDVYSEELDQLKIDGPYKFGGLCLCILFNNQLNESLFATLPEKFKSVVASMCDHCVLNKGTSPILIRNELDTLEKTYINKHDGFYEIYHDKLFDFMAFYFGQMMTQCFIDHADSGLLRDRFSWKKSIGTDEDSIENRVLFEDIFLQPYINRMISDWTNRKVSDVFYNVNMRSSLFREEFLKSLKTVDRSKAKTLASMKDVFREDFASGNTPIIISCLDGYVDLLKWLLEHNANVNDCRKDGSSALCMACEKNNVEAVNILLENNAKVNVCTEAGVSPLGLACYFNGNVQIISELLKREADVNMHRLKEHNMTPLFMACEKNFLLAATELLNNGADHGICLSNGMSVLLAACQNGSTDIVRLLLEHNANPNTQMKDGDTPLFSASGMGFIDITEMLLEKGADLFQCLYNIEKITESYKGTRKTLKRAQQSWSEGAMKFGSPKTKEYIIKKPKDYVLSVFAGSSPLHVACFMGHFEISRLLINKLSDVDIKKQDGTTPLVYACEIGHQNIIRELLKKGPDLKICTGNTSLALTFANLKGEWSCSKCLQDGHQTTDCTNDWVCKSCGQHGHKQKTCINNTFSDVPEQPEKDSKENNKTSDAVDEISESEMDMDAT